MLTIPGFFSDPATLFFAPSLARIQLSQTGLTVWCLTSCRKLSWPKGCLNPTRAGAPPKHEHHPLLAPPHTVPAQEWQHHMQLFEDSNSSTAPCWPSQTQHLLDCTVLSLNLPFPCQLVFSEHILAEGQRDSKISHHNLQYHLKVEKAVIFHLLDYSFCIVWCDPQFARAGASPPFFISFTIL